MSLYTERHNMRTPIQKTYTISVRAYSLLYDCCSRYFEYLAWKYPEECPDGRGCCGFNFYQFSEDMEFEIPTLFRSAGNISKPTLTKNVFTDEVEQDDFDQYALIDLIEFVAQNIRDITRRDYHSFFGHEDLSFGTTNGTASRFVADINAVFKKTGLLYCLTTNLEIERVEETAILSDAIETEIATITEPGLKELLITAIQKHKSPYPEDQKDAVEKIWDAFERLKSYYATKKEEKRQSINTIVTDISGGEEYFKQLFDKEIRTLTEDIGNACHIRHSEVWQVDITDIRHYDYFYNRCLSLIALAIQYLRP